jgi:hypothetical protein
MNKILVIIGLLMLIGIGTAQYPQSWNSYNQYGSPWGGYITIPYYGNMPYYTGGNYYGMYDMYGSFYGSAYYGNNQWYYGQPGNYNSGSSWNNPYGVWNQGWSQSSYRNDGWY